VRKKKSLKTLTPGANVIKLFSYLFTIKLSDAPLYGRLLALPTNVRLGWKDLPGTNALAYYEKA
jgi:hypothetical protein